MQENSLSVCEGWCVDKHHRLPETLPLGEQAGCDSGNLLNLPLLRRAAHTTHTHSTVPVSWPVYVSRRAHYGFLCQVNVLGAMG